MAKNPINVLIADDDKEKCYVLKEFFRTSKYIDVCGVVHNGYKVLESIDNKQPDIVLLDIMMPNLDGIGVLHKLKLIEYKKPPKIIIISLLSEDFILNEALNSGACYYMIKPFSLKSLYKMILVISEYNETSKLKLTTYSGANLDNIRKKIISIGIPTNVIGYKYIIESIELMFRESCTCNLLKNIYDKLAKNNSTTSQCVESAIRNAIKQATKNPTYDYKNLFLDFIEQNKHPSNLRFLTKVTEMIRIDYKL